jgi:hypothetical protein
VHGREGGVEGTRWATYPVCAVADVLRCCVCVCSPRVFACFFC